MKNRRNAEYRGKHSTQQDGLILRLAKAWGSRAWTNGPIRGADEAESGPDAEHVDQLVMWVKLMVDLMPGPIREGT